MRMFGGNNPWAQLGMPVDMGAQTPPFAPAAAAPPMSFGTGQSAPVAPHKPGFFDRVGLGLSLLGNISDGVLELNGMKPSYGPMMEARRARREELADKRSQREDALNVWVQQQAYKSAHPDPVNNDTVNDYAFIKQTQGPAAADEYLTNFRKNGGGAPQIVQTPYGTFSVPRSPSTAPAAPSGPQPGAIEGGYRFKGGNAADPTAWEPVGGAPSQGGATFR